MDRNKHCGYCGTEFTTPVWPRNCLSCERTTYNNPTPVVLCVQPVQDGNRLGLAICKRAIPPCVGGWALIGGHIENNGETVQQAGAREFSEETSLDIGNKPRVIDSYTNGVGHLMIVIESDPISWDYFKTGRPCPENLALDVLWEPRELVFHTHTEIVLKWFKKHSR